MSLDNNSISYAFSTIARVNFEIIYLVGSLLSGLKKTLE